MKLTNTLSGKIEEFIPQGDEVTIYVCGVTPYSDSHFGHAMNHIIFDVLRRYLVFRGYRVKYIQNITDIEDKIIDRAAKLGVTTEDLVAKYTESYFEDMDGLNVLRADFYPRATEEIDEIIKVVKGLVDKGFAYPAGGSVYFRVRSVSDYGKLSHRSLDAMEASEDTVGSEEKEDAMDFALWKAAKPGEPAWDSPWGMGRPGWHIECSVMSLKYLGDTLDIHAGGQDLVFPHHENEIAQSESYTGVKPFARYWLHNGMLQLRDEKMSKSLGNLVTIKEVLSRYSADAIRIFVLGSHYRGPLTYSEEALEAAEKGAERLRWTASEERAIDKKTGNGLDTESFRQRFTEAMDDDLGTAQAIATLFDLVREINRAYEAGYDAPGARDKLKELAGVLGLTLQAPESQLVGAEPFIDLLISTRVRLRESKQYQLADEIRDKLTGLGVVLEDTPQGTVWKIKR